MSLTVVPIAEPDVTAWHITLATASEVQTALNTVATMGWAGTVQVGRQPNSNSLAWSLTLTKGNVKLNAYNNWWIVSDGINVMVFNDDDFRSRYTANVPLVWAATDTAPTAAAQAGLAARLTMPQPTSPNGPFTFEVTQTNTTEGETGPGDIAVELANGMVNITVNGLTADDEYIFEVVCNTQYDGVSATSLTTDSITAVL